MKRQIFTIVCLLATLFASAQRGHFFSSDDFSSSLISALCQDRQGSVWVATDYGLNRFDGYHFQTFLHDDADSTSLQANVVVTMLCDRDGRLWVGTNRGLDRFDDDRETFYHYKFPDNIRPRVTSLIQLKNGTLLVGTAGYGAFTLTSPDAQLETFQVENADNFFSYVYEDKQGRLWKSSFDDQIMMWEGKKMHTFRSQLGNLNGFIEHDDHFDMLALRGLMTYRDGKIVPANVDMSVAASRNLIFTCMERSADGILYLGTRGDGLYRIVDRRLERVEANAFGIDLNTAKISAIMFDRSGNLWVACHSK